MATERSKMNKSIVLRICKADMTGYNGFIWPTKGHVEAPDWEATQECGHGLHGWFEAQGDASYSSYLMEPDAKYLVLKVKTDSIIHLDGKCKFPRAKVCFVGSRNEAIAYIDETYPYLRTMPLLFSNRTVGDNNVVATGDFGTAKAGRYGTARAGFRGTATVGNYGTATAGYNGTATAGFRGTATAGYNGTATAGCKGTATTGDFGTAAAGDFGIATAGNRGTATAGEFGTATVGEYGTAMAGDRGIIQIHYFNGRDRIAIGYIGEKGLKPNVKYTLDANHNFVEIA